MYNEKIKNEFLNESDYDKDTIHTYTNTFNNMEKFEDKLGKDLYEMNLEELEDALSFVGYRKMDRVINLISNIRVYTKWATKKGYRNSEINGFPLVLTPEYFSQFVNSSGDFYLTRNELLNFLDATPDYSIKACMLAVFEGIGGRGYQELSNIRMSDIYNDGGKWYINLVNELDGSIRRRHPISDELYKMFYDASITTVFRGMDGEIKYHLIDTPYIFRHFISRRNAGVADSMIGKTAGAKLYELYLKHFREAFGILDSHQKFSLKELKYSGMMHYLNEALNEQEKDYLVTSSTVDKVAERFIMPVQKNAGREYIVYSKVKGMVVEDFMKEAYGKRLRFDFSRSSRKVNS